MSREDVILFNQVQIKEIEVHKWIESEKAGYDLGDSACLDWIKKHAQQFRKEWMEERKAR